MDQMSNNHGNITNTWNLNLHNNNMNHHHYDHLLHHSLDHILMSPQQLIFTKNDDQQMDGHDDDEELGEMKEMMYKMAAMQSVDIDPATVRRPRRRNVRISDDPQSVAARQRRERIGEKIRVLQRLVPGGTKMDTASMLDEAIRYVKFLKRHIRRLQSSDHHHSPPPISGNGVSHNNLSFNHEVCN